MSIYSVDYHVGQVLFGLRYVMGQAHNHVFHPCCTCWPGPCPQEAAIKGL